MRSSNITERLGRNVRPLGVNALFVLDMGDLRIRQDE